MSRFFGGDRLDEVVMRHWVRFYIGIFILLFCSRVTIASEPLVTEKLFQMPLEQLLSISVVSKESERITVSPGIVTTYQAKQLMSMGLSSLKDFIHFIPGVELNARLNPPALIQVRGTPATTNQKILFLLNGVPYWMPENGEFPLYGIPLAAIDRIEVIRGPGSVIYGTNASAGVINVITRDDSLNELLVSANNNGLREGSAYFAGELSKDFTYNLALDVQRGGKYDYQVENAFALDFTQTANGRLSREVEFESVLGQVSYQNLELMLQSYQSREKGDANASLTSPSVYDANGTLVSLNYSDSADWGKYEFYSDWNRFYREVDTESGLLFFGVDAPTEFIFDNSGRNNTRFRNGMSVQLALDESVKLMAGAEYEERRTENKKFSDTQNGNVFNQIMVPPFTVLTLQPDGTILLVMKDKAYEKSGFVQLDGHFDQWRFVIGGRYVDNSVAGSDVSPRGSIIYSLNDNESLKILYSEGFNSPTFSQSASTDSLGVPLNNDVKAETIQTWDLAYTHSSRASHHVVSFFHTEVEDLITSNANLSERFKRNGLEYEFQHREGALQWLTGLSYIREGDGMGSDDAADFASNWLLKAGVEYTRDQHLYGASLRSASERENVSSYHLLNLHYAYDTGRGLVASLTLDNILNDGVDTPEVRDGRPLVIEGQDGFGVTLGLNFRFGEL